MFYLLNFYQRNYIPVLKILKNKPFIVYWWLAFLLSLLLFVAITFLTLGQSKWWIMLFVLLWGWISAYVLKKILFSLLGEQKNLFLMTYFPLEISPFSRLHRTPTIKKFLEKNMRWIPFMWFGGFLFGFSAIIFMQEYVLGISTRNSLMDKIATGFFLFGLGGLWPTLSFQVMLLSEYKKILKK